MLGDNTLQMITTIYVKTFYGTGKCNTNMHRESVQMLMTLYGTGSIILLYRLKIFARHLLKLTKYSVE